MTNRHISQEYRAVTARGTIQQQGTDGAVNVRFHRQRNPVGNHAVGQEAVSAELRDQPVEVLQGNRIQTSIFGQGQSLVTQREDRDQFLVLESVDLHLLPQLGHLFDVRSVPLGRALPHVANEDHDVDRQHLDAEAFQQFAFVDDCGPEEIDPLTDVADTHPGSQGVGRMSGPDKALHPFLKLRLIGAAILNVGERDAQLVQDFAGGHQPAQAVPQARSVCFWRIVARSPQQRRHFQITGNDAHGALGAKVTVGHEQPVNALRPEVRHRGRGMGLVADHSILEHLVEIDKANIPLPQALLQDVLVAHGVFVAEDKFADRAQAQKRLLLVHLCGSVA